MLLVAMICVLALMRLVRGFLSGRVIFPEPAFLLPLWVLLVLAGFQIPALPGFEAPISVDPYATLRFVCFLAGLILAFDLLIATCRTYSRLNFLVVLVITIAVASAVFGLTLKWLPVLTAASFEAFGSTDAIYAQFANRNHFAFLMEMAVGLLTGLLLKGDLSRPYIFLSVAAYVVVVISLIDVQSRGGLISWAVMSVIAVFFHILTRTGSRENETRRAITRPNSQLIRRIITAIGICCLVLGSIAILIGFAGGDELITRLENIEQEISTTDDPARINRGQIWSTTVELIKQNPLAGFGFGAYAAAITGFDTSAGKFSLEEAHNDYLELAANGGMAAVFLVLWFAIAVGRKIVGNFRSSAETDIALCFGATVGIAGVAFHSLVDFGLHVPVNILVLFVLIVIATAQLRESEGKDSSADQIVQKPTSKKLSIKRFFILAAYAVFIVIVCFFAVKTGLSDHYTNLAFHSGRIDDADRAVTYNSANSKAYIAKSVILRGENRLEEAAAALEESVRFGPGDYHSWMSLGEVRKSRGELAAAEEAFRRAVSLAPNYSLPNYELGLTLLAQRRLDEAFQYLRIAAHGDRAIYPDIIKIAATTFSNDPQMIEAAIGFDTPYARKSVAEFFIENSTMTDSTAAFLTGSSLNRGEKFVFIEKLIAARNFALAREVWLSNRSEPGFAADETLFDGGFENLTDANQGPFGWQVEDDLPFVTFAISETDVFSGKKALSVRFNGNVELDTKLVSQLAIVSPNTEFQLRFAYKSREAVSAGLPEIIIKGAASNEVLGRSGELRSTGENWAEVKVDLRTNNEQAVYISFQRDRCGQSPCPIFGHFVFDNFSFDKKPEIK